MRYVKSQITFLHNIRICIVNASPSIIRVSRRLRWAEHEALMGEMRNAYSVQMEKLNGRERPLGRPMRRWKDDDGVGRCGLYSSGSG
jgi:hypothetical protein